MANFQINVTSLSTGTIRVEAPNEEIAREIARLGNDPRIISRDVKTQTSILKIERLGPNLDGLNWIDCILTCIYHNACKEFSLQDLYSFEPLLKQRWPSNCHIKNKIQQIVQQLAGSYAPTAVTPAIIKSVDGCGRYRMLYKNAPSYRIRRCKISA